jgi:DinB superfamily
MAQYNIQATQQHLLQTVQQVVDFLTQIDSLNETQLLQQPAAGGWSLAQVMEHLNVYCRHYLPLIELAIKQGSGVRNTYQSGWLGEYFTKLMQPLPDGTITKKMQAPANAKPVQALNALEVKHEFEHHQHHLIKLLQEAHRADWQKVRIPTSLSQWIRLRMGDTLRFFVAHEYRHLLQMQRILKQVS